MPETMDVLEQIREHLQYFGYEIEKRDDDSFRATHGTHWNFHVARRLGGVLVQFYVGTEPGAGPERFHRYINDLNREAVVTRFYVDQDGDFVGEAWWPLTYERAAFGTFMEAWHHDGALVARHHDSHDLLA